jgi:hypothetical protein
MHRAAVVWRSLDRSVIDVLGQVLQEPIDPAFGKRLVRSADDLNALLRHRLRSISRLRGVSARHKALVGERGGPAGTVVVAGKTRPIGEAAVK